MGKEPLMHDGRNECTSKPQNLLKLEKFWTRKTEPFLKKQITNSRKIKIQLEGNVNFI